MAYVPVVRSCSFFFVCITPCVCVCDVECSVGDLSLTSVLRYKIIIFRAWPSLWSRGQSSWLLNGDVLCFLWGTNWIYICYVEESRPPLWSRGQSSWLQIQRPGFDSRHYQIFWDVVGLDRSPHSLVSTTEELLGRKSSGSGLERREYGSRDPSRWPRGTLYAQKLALTSLTSVGRSVDIVLSRTQATEFSF
jgi:hypothetical protein